MPKQNYELRISFNPTLEPVIYIYKYAGTADGPVLRVSLPPELCRWNDRSANWGRVATDGDLLLHRVRVRGRGLPFERRELSLASKHDVNSSDSQAPPCSIFSVGAARLQSFIERGRSTTENRCLLFVRCPSEAMQNVAPGTARCRQHRKCTKEPLRRVAP